MASAANSVSIDRSTVERIVRQVALEYLGRDKSGQAPVLTVQTSSRHMHVCREDMDVLLGPGSELTFDRPLPLSELQPSNDGPCQGQDSGVGEEPGLGLAGEIGEKHGDGVALIGIAIAGDDHAGAIDFLALAGPLQAEGHLRPGTEGFFAAEFDAVFADANRIGRQGQALGGGGRKCVKVVGGSCSGTHILRSSGY